jgi:hypothetical protein
MNPWPKIEAVLTLRDDSMVGGESTRMRRRVAVLYPPGFAVATNHYVIFVHGYNVSQADARESYARFRWWLEWFDTRVRVLELHWPGNLHEKWGGAASASSFPYKIDIAWRCGRRLAIWLMRQPPGVRFTLIGHSLGCRLVVEAVAILRRFNAMRRLINVCLMAAAVPVRHVEIRTFGPRPGDMTRWRILYSRGDQVLRRAFPPGQLAAMALKKDTAAGTAVGLYGEPTELWKKHGDAWEMYQLTANDSVARLYDHSYYWSGGPGVPEGDERRFWKASLPPIAAPLSDNQGASAEFVAGMLGARVARPIPLRQLPPARNVPDRALIFAGRVRC